MNVDRPGRTVRMPWRKRRDNLPADNETQVSRRIAFLGFLPLGIKNHFVAMMGEFVGTFLFLLFAFGGTNAVNTAPAEGQPTDLAADPAKLLFISLCFGFSLAVNAWVFFRISGGLFNPAVSLAMMIVGAVPYVRGGLVIISQILGGIAAAALVKALTSGPINVRVSIGGGISTVQALFMEMFLTAMLVFAIFMLAAEKHKATFIAPIGIGLALFIAELFGVYYTGGALNPARAFGPCVVAHQFYHYHWIYWVGPALGSLLASGFYLFIKALEYETVNPEQDDDEDPHKKFDPNKAAAGQTFKPAYSPNQYAQDSNQYESRSNDYQNPSSNAARPYTADTNSATQLNGGGNYPMANMAATATGSPRTKEHHESRNLAHGGMDDTYGNGPYIETGLAGPLP